MIAMHDCRTVLGEREAYQFAHIGHRMDGRAEVVVQVTPYDYQAKPRYLSFRRDPGAEWQSLVGSRRVLADAIQAAQSENRIVGMDSPELTALLAMTEARNGAV